MGIRVSQVVIEAIIPRVARSPTTITGAGVTQVVIEAVIAAPGAVRVSQVVVEMVLAGEYDGSHGEPGGCPPGGDPVTHAYGYAT